MRPETTALLPNYPNPFNPETWIPYHLANGSNVQITIYDTRGSIVRTLVLGNRAAGYYTKLTRFVLFSMPRTRAGRGTLPLRFRLIWYYTDKNQAAYWDGRNSVGERIASGVYFYQLQADNVSQLRKMLILK